jgi:glycerol-3-phosphate acyltransferase PlsY
MIIVTCFLAYLIGVFPSGLIISKLHNIDITKQGSGNIGATNISRVIGKKAGVFVLLLDVIKGVLPVVFFHTPLAALFVVLGHCISIPTRLKGGKGVATSLGALCALSLWFFPIGVGTFAVFFYFTRRVSVGSLMAVAVVIISNLVFNIAPDAWLEIVLIGTTVTVRHHENIARLMKGQEPEFKFGTK